MKYFYKVAENFLAISVPQGLAAWEAIEPRFRPFESSEAACAGLDVDIRSEKLPKSVGDVIYEPKEGGVGFIAARALRDPDGCMIMEFKHIAERKRRLWLRMPRELNRAEIAIRATGDHTDHYFLTHALMIAFMIATCGKGTLVIHSSSVIYEGKAYLFQGKSGTGKSTHAGLWIENIEGAELMNDDNPIIRFSEAGVAMAYGSPWSGKTHCYRNVGAPIGAFVRIVHSSENELRRLRPLQAYASLTASVFFMPFLGEKPREMRHKTIERLATGVPCCEMLCRPDAEAAWKCMRGLGEISREV